MRKPTDLTMSKPTPLGRDRVLEKVYTDSVGSLNYRLHLPQTRSERPPLFVMLHGASQNASDFAEGTRMQEVIEACGGIALFPEQSRSAHPLGCWNWYDTRHQFASAGEPSMLAGLTRQIIRDHGVDPGRVYVAGMSAGGAMAVILGQAYPDLYAAVGVHSGIPTGVAHDLLSALRAMSSGPSGAQPVRAASRAAEPSPVIPTIVFHGDRDQTVHPLNAPAILARALSQTVTSGETDGRPAPASMRMQGGREVTLIKHARRKGRPDAELWIVHGAGHAWAGGSAKGSFTDESGPDASREMLRFFLTGRPGDSAVAKDYGDRLAVATLRCARPLSVCAPRQRALLSGPGLAPERVSLDVARFLPAWTARAVRKGVGPALSVGRACRAGSAQAHVRHRAARACAVVGAGCGRRCDVLANLALHHALLHLGRQRRGLRKTQVPVVDRWIADPAANATGLEGHHLAPAGRRFELRPSQVKSAGCTVMPTKSLPT